MKKLFFIILLSSLFLTACSKKEGPNTVRVGTIAGPETKLMEVAKQVALQQFGLDIQIVTFTDYNIPNQALAEKTIDANAFQHLPFLQSQIKARGYNLVSVGNTFLYPMGLYSAKIRSLSQLKAGDKIAIPNDPSNEARALLLLQKANLITLKPNVTINATTQDIATNPEHLKIVSLDAAELPRTLSDVTLAAINTNYAVPAGLSPTKDALFVEGADSPYMNIIVARTADAHEKKIVELVEAYHSQAVINEAKLLFNGTAIAGFSTK